MKSGADRKSWGRNFYEGLLDLDWFWICLVAAAAGASDKNYGQITTNILSFITFEISYVNIPVEGVGRLRRQW
jgi:hypothetical protein